MKQVKIYERCIPVVSLKDLMTDSISLRGSSDFEEETKNTVLK